MKSLSVLCLAAGVLAIPTPQGPPPGSGAGGPPGGPPSIPGVNYTAQHSNEDGKVIMQQMMNKYSWNTLFSLFTAKCNPFTVRRRKNWSNMCKDDRLDYLKSVQCLHEAPPKQSWPGVTGVKNRYDEFVYSHLNQTNFMHVSGLFLPWHRQYMFAYEEALRNECGYKGALPYWEWSEHADNQSASAVFSGAEDSLGGNGAAIPHGPISGVIPNITLDGHPFPVSRDPGSGGGCVNDNSYLFQGKNWTVDLGPVAPANNTPENQFGTDYNPHCLWRDFDMGVSQRSLSYGAVADLMVTPDIHAFRPAMDGNVHPSSHRFVGGDTFDLFTSPNDPIFFLLHTQIDRLWTIWQGQDSKTRQTGLDGTVTFLNTPPSANATLDTVMKMLAAGGDVKISEAMNSMGGKMCYIYE